MASPSVASPCRRSGAPFGNVYVADSGNQRVQEFDHDGAFIRQWGGTGTDDGQFMDPIDVAVGPTGLVYVVDDVRDDIQVFSTEGSFMSKVGGHGSGDGQLDHGGLGVRRAPMAPSTPPTRATAASRPGVRTARSCGPSAARAPGPASSTAHPTSARIPRGNVYVVDRHRLQIFGPDRTQLAHVDGARHDGRRRLRSVRSATTTSSIVDSPYGGPDSNLAYHLLVHWPKS